MTALQLTRLPQDFNRHLFTSTCSPPYPHNRFITVRPVLSIRSRTSLCPFKPDAQTPCSSDYTIEIKMVSRQRQKKSGLSRVISLDLLLGAQLMAVHAEELGRLGRLLAGNVVEGRGGDVVGLALADQAVVLEEILLLGVVDVGLGMEDSLGLASVFDFR